VGLGLHSFGRGGDWLSVRQVTLNNVVERAADYFGRLNHRSRLADKLILLRSKVTDPDQRVNRSSSYGPQDCQFAIELLALGQRYEQLSVLDPNHASAVEP
jgi:hypothetical protein